MISASDTIFLGCDWGSTHLRLYLIDADTQKVLDSISTGQGIISTYDHWKESGTSESDRLLFYKRILENNIRVLESRSGTSLKNAALLISGMASSNLGMTELPYAPLPFPTDGSCLFVEKTRETNNMDRPVLLISGVCSDEDVMRGEELQLVGSGNLVSSKNHLCIFPGTHSKHVMVAKGIAADFKTYLTGELFKNLATKSSLSGFLISDEGDDCAKSFEQGIVESQQANILNSLFHVRSLFLLKKITGPEAYKYLSGLLIGTELKDLENYKGTNIVLVADQPHAGFYQEALAILNFTNVQRIDAKAASVSGYLSVFKNSRL
jgi:2-dehydro-3-deoxygalactonokinase